MGIKIRGRKLCFYTYENHKKVNVYIRKFMEEHEKERDIEQV